MPVVLICLLGTALFAQAFLRLRSRGRPDLAQWWRAALWLAAMAITLFALLGLDARADENLAFHMLQHVLIGDLVPALVVLATLGPLGLFLLPAPVLGPLARSPLRTVVHALLRPPVAFGIWAANLAFWHIPRMYDLALAHAWLHDLEHLCWTIAGLLVWTILLDSRRSPARRVALAAAMFVSGQILTDVLVFSFTPLYPAYPSVRQQQLAGVIMMAEQVLTLGTLSFFLLRPRVRRGYRGAVTA